MLTIYFTLRFVQIPGEEKDNQKSRTFNYRSLQETKTPLLHLILLGKEPSKGKKESLLY